MIDSLLSQVGNSVLDLVYPRFCEICQRSDEELDSPRICSSCRKKLDLIQNRGCPACGARLGPHASQTPKCVHCRTDSFAFTETVSLGIYQEALRQVCLRCKQERSRVLAVQLADLLWEVHQDVVQGWEIDGVVCVPQHWRKRIAGGFCTSAALAERFSQRLRKPFFRRLLVKTKHTSDQARLLPTQRRENVKDAFRVSSRRLAEGRSFLLVDDVFTTGSTANACCRALKHAGASKINVAVIARGLG